MANKKRGWKNPPKYLEATAKGRCPYCKKSVESLEHHIRSKHKGEKGSNKMLSELKIKGFISKYKSNIDNR